MESDIQESRPNGIQKSNIRDFEKNMMSPLQKDAKENPNKFKEANPQYSLDSDEDEEWSGRINYRIKIELNWK